MAKYLLCALLMLGSAMSYGLDQSSDSCEFYFFGDQGSDTDALALLAVAKPGEAVKVCTGSNGNKVYYVASAVSQKGGVTYFCTNRVFKGSSSDEPRWELVPPDNLLHLEIREAYMQVGTGILKQDHVGFIRVKGMSAGLFGALSNLWGSVRSSEKYFDEAVNSLSMLSKLSSDTRALRRALYRDRDAPAILTASYVEGNNSRPPHYTFSVVDRSHMWNIEFDFVGAAISFENIILISE